MPLEQVFHTVEEVDRLDREVRAAALPTAKAIRELVAEAPTEGLSLLRELRFALVGRHPLEDRPLNLVEQLNQTFTILVTLCAVRILLERHPDSGGARARFGTQGGFDIESVNPRLFAAEAFAATTPQSNRKLQKDMERLVTKAAEYQHRYVFFYSPKYPAAGHQPQLEVPGAHVSVYAVSL